MLGAASAGKFAYRDASDAASDAQSRRANRSQIGLPAQHRFNDHVGQSHTWYELGSGYGTRDLNSYE